MTVTTPNVRQALAIRTQRRLWRARAQRWNEQGSLRLREVIDAVLARSPVHPDAVVLDLGCGSGQLTLPLARDAARVLAVDVSAEATQMLEERAGREGISNIKTLARPIEKLEFEPESFDLVVSNYALHHLRDIDKQAALAKAYRWLHPGGRLVVGDMMFGRGVNRRDREIIRSKVKALAARGPAGWWRIVKNGVRFALRFQEKPLSASAWENMAAKAGFTDMTITPVVAEASVMSAIKPADLSWAEGDDPLVAGGRGIWDGRSAPVWRWS